MRIQSALCELCSLLPEAEEGLFTLNVAKAVDITIAPEASLESFRQSNLSQTQLGLDGLSQVDAAHLSSVCNLTSVQLVNLHRR